MSPFDFNVCQLFIALMFLAWLASLERAVGKLAKQGGKAANDLVHLENEHVKLECKVGSLDRATTRLERSLLSDALRAIESACSGDLAESERHLENAERRFKSLAVAIRACLGAHVERARPPA